MSGYRSEPPGGAILRPNQRTRLLRPALPLAVEKAERVRQIRRDGPNLSLEQIAGMVGEQTEAVRYALATLRTRNPSAPWKLLNVTPEAHAFVRRHAMPGEPAWATINRLFARLATLPKGT